MKKSRQIDEATERRLVYVKRLYMHAREHIELQTEFDNMIAIHNLDNSIELLLKCVATYLDVPLSRTTTFYELFNEVNRICKLPKKTEMYHLHELRSNIQHWGISPLSSDVVTSFVVYVYDFIENVIKRVFNVNYEEIFMASLIEDETLREILSTAEKAYEEGDYEKCMRYADATFNKILREKLNLNLMFPNTEDTILSEIINVIEGIIPVLMLGVNFAEYIKYKKNFTYSYWDEKEKTITYSQNVLELIGYDPEYINKQKKNQFSKQNAFFSVNFVINCALGLHL
jgi:HEPN domain-containing protein